MIWKILGIEATKDEELIKAAYREKLHYVNPEDDEEGFKELRKAYEDALEYAGQPEDASEDEPVSNEKKDEVDLWIDKIDRIYQDAKTRTDESAWKNLLNDPICDDLDTELEAAEKLLVYFMSHSFMPQNIWQLVDERFHYLDTYEQLKEKFPENYLEYIKWQIENPGFLDFALFDGKTDDKVDEYINKYYQTRACMEQSDLDGAGKLLKELQRYDVYHPFIKAEEANYLLAKAKQDEDFEAKKQALSIMEELDFEYCESPYIERVYADCLVANKQMQKAMDIYETLLEKDENNLYARIGKADCIYRLGNPEDAKEYIEDILEDEVQNTDCLDLLDEINESLVDTYREKLKQEKIPEIVYKLGWCYYQQKKFEEGIKLLDELEVNDDYDYVNLRCRLYLANENYDRAYPLAKKWLDMILKTEDDGSREAKKRLNRRSLAHFALGTCVWEYDYKNTEDEDAKEQAFGNGVSYLSKAIDEENNLLVRLSYKEQLARFYLEAGKYEACIDECSDILEENSGFFPAYVHRQKAYYEIKDAKGVIDDFFSCKEIYAAYAPPYLLAAEVFYAFEQYDDVEHVIADAKEAGIESDTLKLYEIRLLHYKEFSKENTTKALERMKQLRQSVFAKQDAGSEEEKTDIEDLAEMEREFAILYWDLDEIKMTVGVINAFLEKEPDNMIMLQLKIDVLNRENSEKEALDICKKLVDLDKTNLSNQVKLGNCYERNKLYNMAIEVYQNVLKKDERYPQAIRRLMYIYSFLSNRERDLDKCRIGIEYASRLIEVTGSAEGYVERGNLLIDLYELEEAVSDCKKAIEIDPEVFYAYNNMGCALLKLRRIDEAIKPLEQIIKMSPEYDHLPYINLAECYALQKRYKEAIALYEKVMEIWPKRVGYLEEEAILYAKMEDYDRAIAIYQNIPNVYKDLYEQKKNDDEYLANVMESYCDIMKLYAQMGEYKKGSSLVRKTMKLLGKYQGKHFPSKIDNIIEFFRDQGDFKNAEKYAVKLLDIAQKRDYSTKNLIFAYATTLFSAGNKEKAAAYAKIYLENLYKNEGSEETLFADKRYIPMHAYNFAIMHICMGENEKACEYLSRIPDCKYCVMCVSCGCFEYYFGMGLLAQLNGRLEEAKQFYEKAIQIKGRYAIAEFYLARVNQMITK